MFLKTKFPRDFEERIFIVGKNYKAFGRTITFIQSTLKGFNFVDHEKNQLLFMCYHLYDRGYTGRDIPVDIKEVRVKIHKSWSRMIYE